MRLVPQPLTHTLDRDPADRDPTDGAPIQVEAEDGRPARLVWRGLTYAVTSVEETWCIDGRWWLDPDLRGEHRDYFRLFIAAPGRTSLCVEVYRCGESWKLSRLAD